MSKDSLTKILSVLEETERFLEELLQKASRDREILEREVENLLSEFSSELSSEINRLLNDLKTEYENRIETLKRDYEKRIRDSLEKIHETYETRREIAINRAIKIFQEIYGIE